MKQDEKKNEIIKNENNENEGKIPNERWVEDAKEELEDYIEEQGVYLRQ